MSVTWGKKNYINTLKHLFQNHFDYQGDDSWDFNPHDKEKVTKRIIPTIRMVLSWENKKVLTLTDRKIVGKFLSIIKNDYPNLYKLKQTSNGM